MTQREAVIETLKQLGGIATLGQLNQEVFRIKECTWKTKTPFASIRRIVQLDKEIYRIKPGLYALEASRMQLEANGIVVETNKNKDSKAVEEFTHSYYQGILLKLGNLRKFKTFSPNQDRNKMFLGKEKLGDIRSLNTMPNFTYDSLVNRSQTIDVIWFNDRSLPDSFYEVEHSTDIQNSLLKFEDLQDFYVRMFIVADRKRKVEFNHILQYNGFSDLRKNNRVAFLDYESLVHQYELECESHKIESPI